MKNHGKAHMVRVTSPGLPENGTDLRAEYRGLFEYISEPVIVPGGSVQMGPDVEVWQYTTPRVTSVTVSLEALVSEPMFTLNPGLYFGLELWAEMPDVTAGTFAWGVYRLHHCKLREFSFGVRWMEATPVPGTDQIWRAWVETVE